MATAKPTALTASNHVGPLPRELLRERREHNDRARAQRRDVRPEAAYLAVPFSGGLTKLAHK